MALVATADSQHSGGMLLINLIEAVPSKNCTVCGVSKQMGEFYPGSSHLGRRPACIECAKGQVAKDYQAGKHRPGVMAENTRRAMVWYWNNRLKVIERGWLRNYGMTSEDVARLLHKQECCCAICEVDLLPVLSTNGWAIDHDHASGRVRGMLCSACNTALGLLRESLRIVAAMGSYIEKHK